MPTNFKFRELRIQIRSDVLLVVEVSSIADVKAALDQLKDEELLSAFPPPPKGKHDKPDKRDTDEPASIIELSADIPANSLSDNNVLAFKNGVPQLIRPNMFGSVTEAVLVLLYSVEVGLKNNTIAFDSFKQLYDGQSIKAGSPLPMLITNLKNSGYIDRRTYDTSRNLTLSPKGAKKAVAVIKEAVKNSSPNGTSA